MRRTYSGGWTYGPEIPEDSGSLLYDQRRFGSSRYVICPLSHHQNRPLTYRSYNRTLRWYWRHWRPILRFWYWERFGR